MDFTMGFFNKENKTSTSGTALPPAPPSPNAMPAPPAASTSTEMAPAPSMGLPQEQVPGLPTPPMPGASLDDIKSQVSNGISQAPEPPVASVQESAPVTSDEDSSSSLNQEDDELDSLFDISDLELPEDSSQDVNDEHQISDDSTDDVSQKTSNSAQSQFIAHHREIEEAKPFFVTTSQFKSLLEIIEGVKQKAKESSERHLRLLDIKSEEDIEYENLKKDFAYIEDKLYEVDTLIFEND